MTCWWDIMTILMPPNVKYLLHLWGRRLDSGWHRWSRTQSHHGRSYVTASGAIKGGENYRFSSLNPVVFRWVPWPVREEIPWRGRTGEAIRWASSPRVFPVRTRRGEVSEISEELDVQHLEGFVKGLWHSRGVHRDWRGNGQSKTKHRGEAERSGQEQQSPIRQ